MTNKECRDTRREIDELEVGHRPSVAAAAHMAGCSACQKFQAERTSLRELVGSLEPVVAPPDFDMRLRARIAAEKYDKRQQPFFARLISTPALAAAALFVLVAGSVFWISRRTPAPVVPPRTPAVAVNNGTKSSTTVNQSDKQEVPPTIDEGSEVASNGSSKGHRMRTPRAAETEDSLVRGAESIRQTDLDTAYVPNRPAEFALQNESGKTRRISVPPVSFGAQNLVSDTRTNVSYSPSSRVW
jgi:hypothetical protein